MWSLPCETPVTEGSLRKLIREELATLQQPKETKKTWAAVAPSDVVPNKAAICDASDSNRIDENSASEAPPRGGHKYQWYFCGYAKENVEGGSGGGKYCQHRERRGSCQAAAKRRHYIGQESKDWHTENPAWAITGFGPTA
jgi:hypothetical protein